MKIYCFSSNEPPSIVETTIKNTNKPHSMQFIFTLRKNYINIKNHFWRDGLSLEGLVLNRVLVPLSFDRHVTVCQCPILADHDSAPPEERTPCTVVAMKRNHIDYKCHERVAWLWIWIWFVRPNELYPLSQMVALFPNLLKTLEHGHDMRSVQIYTPLKSRLIF